MTVLCNHTRYIAESQEGLASDITIRQGFRNISCLLILLLTSKILHYLLNYYYYKLLKIWGASDPRFYRQQTPCVTLYSIININAICELHTDNTHYTVPSLLMLIECFR